MTTEQINQKVSDVLSFIQNNPQFKKNLDALVTAYQAQGYIEFLSWFSQINDGKLVDDLLLRWKLLLVEQE